MVAKIGAVKLMAVASARDRRISAWKVDRHGRRPGAAAQDVRRRPCSAGRREGFARRRPEERDRQAEQRAIEIQFQRIEPLQRRGLEAARPSSRS